MSITFIKNIYIYKRGFEKENSHYVKRNLNTNNNKFYRTDPFPPPRAKYVGMGENFHNGYSLQLSINIASKADILNISEMGNTLF